MPTWPPDTTWRNTSYSEVTPRTGSNVSPVGSFDGQRWSFQRQYWVPWEDQAQAVSDFVGYSTTAFAGDGTRYISRVTPHYHAPYQLPPLSPVGGIVRAQTYYLWCTRLDRLEPWAPTDPWKDGTDDTAVAVYQRARMTFTYESLPFGVLTDEEMPSGVPDESTLLRYVSVQVNPAARYVALPEGLMKYVLNPADPTKSVPVRAGQGLIQPEHDMALTWWQIPEVAVRSQTINRGSLESDNLIDTTIGTVNNADWNGFHEGTLLLVAAPIHGPFQNSIGLNYYNIEYRFKLFDPAGDGSTTHNWALYKDTSDPANVVFRYFEVSSDGSHYDDDDALRHHIYNGSDFNQLFRAAP